MLQYIEVAAILGLIFWQVRVYRKNRQLIAQVAELYPAREALSVATVSLADPAVAALPEYEKLLRGKATFTWTRYPDKIFIVAGPAENDELGIDAWDEAGRSWVRHGATARNTFASLYQLKTVAFAENLPDSRDYDAVRASAGSAQFAQILADTNDYLQANKGAAADFDALRDISERESDLLDEEIQAQIATPLYLGLLGTFGGAIIGLLALVNPFAAHPAASAAAGAAATSFTENNVTDFLGGILIAMGGSIVGLGLTLVGNQQLKAARARRDRLKNAYYNFLQKTLLPKLNSDMQQSMSSLKAVLDTFNQDFFSKIQGDFFSKIAEFTPLIGAITANISVQKDFLDKLQKIGYTELANATIKVFDRVDESAASFEKFLGYQQALNVAVSNGADTATTITALLNRLGSLEKALSEVPGYLAQHDERLREQVQFFGQHNQLLRNVGDQITNTLSDDAQQMRQILQNRREAFVAESQGAHAEWAAHFRQLNENNIYQKITEYLNPFQQLPAQQQQLNQLQEEQARRSAAALTALQERIGRDEQLQRELLAQVQRTNTVLEKLTEPKWYQRVFQGNPRPPANGPAPGKAKSA